MISVICVAIAICAVSAVTARSSTGNTPLYTVRMEQASSKMNFLPTALNSFTYTTEKGYTVNYEGAKYCGNANPLELDTSETCSGWTCYPSCLDFTCEGITCWGSCDGWTCSGVTCWDSCDHFTCDAPRTCPDTCEWTCPQTCITCEGWTCDETSCQETCHTCSTCNTCNPTCDEPTCLNTCEQTCHFTCEKPCIP